MSASRILRPRKPTVTAVGAFVLTGVGLLVVKSYFTNNAFAESTEPPSALSSTFGSSLRLQSAESVNHNTKRLRFEFPNPDSRSGLALTSAVLVVTWPKGRIFPVLRPYTPVSRLDQPGFLELLVKKYPDGKASSYLHSMSPGETLYFATSLKGYRWTPNQHPSITLIAGGAGITPIYQLAQGILHNPEDKTNITLVFGVNSDADILFKKEFEEFEQRYPGRFKAVYTVSHPVEGSPFKKGYVTKDLLEEIAVGTQEKSTKIFICGPPAMETALLGGGGPFMRGPAGILEQLGYRKDQIHKF